MRRIIVIILLALLAVAVYAEARPVIAVSIVPEATFVKAVGGDLVEVVTMVPPGYSPENYSPSPKELQKFSEASVYFTIGVSAEVVGILPRVGAFNKNLKIVSLQEEVEKFYAPREFAPGSRDPHIWLSPRRVKIMIQVITRELSLLDKSNEKSYIENAREYIAKLDKLNTDIILALDDVKTKTFIVYHPSFGYLADDYGLEMIALEEEGKEATVRRLQDVIDLAKDRGIKVIFYQAEIDSRQTAAFAREIGGTARRLEPLASDYLGNMYEMLAAFRGVLE